jgi:uracil-DNA glycosylase
VAFCAKKGSKIDKLHLVLESGHPSPLSANQGKWFGNNHFSKAIRT